MEAVHHMILYGGRGCGGKILYAWARTGQTSPMGLNYAEETLEEGHGILVDPSGARGGVSYFSLQIHYQLEGTTPIRDSSGLRLWLSPEAPKRPLQIVLNALSPSIPARSVVDECVRCRVTRAGTVIGWRNHAHSLGRDIWSDHVSADGRAQPPLGLISAEQPQIIRILASPRELAVGDWLQLHCIYNASTRSAHTYVGAGVDGEMCNQYLVSSMDLRVQCYGINYANRSRTCEAQGQRLHPHDAKAWTAHSPRRQGYNTPMR